MEEGAEAGDIRAVGSWEIWDGGPAAISLMPDVHGMHVSIFKSSQLEDLYVGDLLILEFVI